MNKTKHIVLFPIAACIRSHCQGEQSAESVQVGARKAEKDFPCIKSVESVESLLAGRGRKGNLGGIGDELLVRKKPAGDVESILWVAC